jgi:hypothetical protein
MTAETILVLSALVCAIGVTASVACAIKWRKEEWVYLLIIGALISVCGAGWCIQEAVKRADGHERQRSDSPTDIRPA